MRDSRGAEILSELRYYDFACRSSSVRPALYAFKLGRHNCRENSMQAALSELSDVCCRAEARQDAAQELGSEAARALGTCRANPRQNCRATTQHWGPGAACRAPARQCSGVRRVSMRPRTGTPAHTRMPTGATAPLVRVRQRCDTHGIATMVARC